MKLRLTILKEPAGFLGQNVLKTTRILLSFFEVLFVCWVGFLWFFVFSKKGREVMQIVVPDNPEEHL